MSNTLYKDYWRFGFKTRLYDFMSPLGYIHSIRAAVKRLEIVPGDRVLDAGCGTGLAIQFVHPRLKQEECGYIGIDVLPEGLAAAKRKLGLYWGQKNVGLIQADISKSLPFKGNIFSKILAHFSVYTLPDRKSRLTAWRSMYTTMKPGGTLVAANPSMTYNPKKIVEDSLLQLRQEKRGGAALMAKLVYPFTEKLGLCHIKHQLDQKVWHAYSLNDFKEELNEAGLVPMHCEPVYCASGWLIVAKKL